MYRKRLIEKIKFIYRKVFSYKLRLCFGKLFYKLIIFKNYIRYYFNKLKIKSIFKKSIKLKLLHFSKVLENKDFLYFSKVLIKGKYIEPNPSIIISDSACNDYKYLEKVYKRKEKDVRLLLVKNAYLYGDVELIRYKNKCFLSDFFNSYYHISADEFKDNININRSFKNLTLYTDENLFSFKDKSSHFIKDGLYLNSACGKNFYHWLTEVAPKLVIYNEYVDKKVTLLINQNLHPNIRELLSIINTNKYKIIELKKGEKYIVEKLYYISGISNVPFEFRKDFLNNNFHENNIIDVYYNKEAFNLLKETITSNVNQSKSHSPKKIYIQREKSLTRKILNIEEVEAFLKFHDFNFIDPMNYGVNQLNSLLNNAEIVVVQGGSAMGNLLFLKNRAKILILVANHSRGLYHTFSNLLSILGHQCYFIFGESKSFSSKSISNTHQDFLIDLSDLGKIIKL